VPRATEFRSGPSGSAMLRYCERFPADNPAHRRIVAQALGVVHVRISIKAAEYRLPQQADQRMAAVPAGSRVSECLAAISVKPNASSSFRYANNLMSDVTADPRNWSIRRRSKSSRTTSDSASPVGCAMSSLDPMI
jgi:hypothetical protein